MGEAGAARGGGGDAAQRSLKLRVEEGQEHFKQKA